MTKEALDKMKTDLLSKVGKTISTSWGKCEVIKLGVIDGKDVVWLENDGDDFYCDLEGFKYR